MMMFRKQRNGDVPAVKPQPAGNRVARFGLEWIMGFFAAVVVLPVAAWVDLRGLLRVLSLRLTIAPASDASRYRIRVTNLLTPWILLALILVIVGATSIYLYYFRTHPPGSGSAPKGFGSVRSSRLLASGAAIALAVVSMVLTVSTESRIEPMLRPFQAELDELETFPAPADWRRKGASSELSEYPAATRFWQTSQPTRAICQSLEMALMEWADDEPVAATPTLPNSSCSYRTLKGPDQVDALVFASGQVNVTLKRIEPVNPLNLKDA